MGFTAETYSKEVFCSKSVTVEADTRVGLQERPDLQPVRPS